MPMHLSSRVLCALALLWSGACGADSDAHATGAASQEDPPERAPLPALAPLPPLVDVGPIPPAQWNKRPFLPGDSSDTITLKSREAGFTVQDTIVQASARTAFICYQNGGPYRGTTLRNSILRVDPGTIPLERSYWAFRGYDMIDTVLDRVEITGFGKVTYKHDEGHAIYFNIAGSLLLEDCHIHHNGGQALQLVNRPSESILPSGPAAGCITIRRTAFRENGFNPDRGAFQVSIFGTGQAISMEDVEIIAGRDGTPYPGDHTGGALLIEAEGHSNKRPVWWRPAELPEDFPMPFAQGRVELVRVRIDHQAPNRPLVQIRGCEELIVRDCRFHGGRIDLDLPGKPGRESGRIVWEGNGGSAEVFVRGRHMGPAGNDFVIE